MKKLAIVLSIAISSLASFAQQDLTLYHMDYIQQASFTNPSYFTECKVSVGGPLFLMGSTTLRYGNSGMTINSLTNSAEGKAGIGKTLDRMRDLNYFETEFRRDLVHVSFRIKERNFVGLNISLRTQTRVTYARDAATLLLLGNGLSEADAAEAGISSDYALLGKRASLDGSGVDVTAFGEIGLQYSRKFMPEDQLTIGIRPKVYLGLLNIQTANLALGFETDENSFAYTFDGEYTLNVSSPLPIDSIIDDTDYVTENLNEFKPFANLGFGLDLGGNYWINDKINVSASATDIGFITWKSNVDNYTTAPGVVEFSGASVDGSIFSQGADTTGEGFAQVMLDSVISQFGPDTTHEEYRTWLTARYNLGAKYQFAEKHNVSMLVQTHMIKRKLRAAMSLGYNFRVHKWFGFSATYSIYNRSFLNLGLGLTFNVFPFQAYAMMDNVLATIPPLTPYAKNAHLRFGVNWTFGCGNDKDKDGITDKKDDCPETPGLAQFKGCPDTDGDGIMDKNDSCVTIAGPVETNGCPDRDGDGIMDMEDDCPDTPGIVEFKGCPDTDNDGIMDKLDSCALDSGLIEFNGCPDTDADGIMDKEDACPLKFGTLEYEGCPDTDGDGLPDHKDGCPDTPGPVDNNGCPYGDKDGDGVPDKEDDCIDTPGPVENKGCPYADLDGDGVLDKDDACIDVPGPPENNGCPFSDLDGDGVLDKDDRCPQTPGPATNQGCPEIQKEEQEVLNTAFSNLEFETGKDKIKSSSFESLDNLAALLVKKEDWKIQISGHTDNVGNDAANMKLSEDRAKSVSKYLESKGVARPRMIVQWYGETKPIADNGTADGRSQNRRVEMDVVFD